MTDSDLLFYLDNCTLRETNGNELTTEQKETFWKAMNMLLISRKKYWFLRGESDINLQRHYYTDSSNPTLLAEVIFNVGAKGRFCLREEDDLMFNNTSKTNFSIICDLIQEEIFSRAIATYWC